MKTIVKYISCLVAVPALIVMLSSSISEKGNSNKTHFQFPYQQPGLTDRQAAAHLLGRFTFGAKPGQVDELVNMGLENWFLQQMNGGLADDTLQGLLSGYDALTMSNEQVVNTFPKPGQILKMAIKDGLIDKDAVNKTDKKEYRAQLQPYMEKKGLRPEKELFRQFSNQKILRAANTNNQLQEVLTDFWFNHFNVSMTKNDCSEYIPAYERDAIRPNANKKFQDLLMATAKSPAMLMYLDNFSSSGENSNENNPQQQKRRQQFLDQMAKGADGEQKEAINKLKQGKKNQGLNENYAREVMELHTLGVDGGYTQQDVTQAARVLTGWTVFPFNDYGGGGGMKKLIERIGEDKLQQRGFVHQGDFLFAMNRHDDKEKVVLGKKFSAGGGYEEGVELLTMLAHHPSTAKFISKKLAVRFVSDNPPQSLIDKMAETFTKSDGDIKQVLVTMASSPEFWNKDALREKTKSPFELAISSIRGLNATVRQPYQVYNWITKMGQKMYNYQAPTGFPDKGQYWINTGSLLNRMNFGLALASKRIPGISFDLAALNNHHEPESAQAALTVYGKLLMPERNLDETIKRLTPLLNDPSLTQKIDDAAGKNTASKEVTTMQSDDEMMTDNDDGGKVKGGGKKGFGKKKNDATTMDMETYASNNGDKSMLSQVVGIIIGSPEYQRK